MDQPKKISQEPVATTIGENDRFVILYGANTVTPTLRTISSNNVINTMYTGLPVYDTNEAALGAGLTAGALYVTTTGFVKLVLAA